ncbi:tagatose 1,6-diphosphate aldolase [Bordetella genomosp. 11]|uniref:Tagatose-bisphosphate aldolase n=1 Tax=Bordetella genomosp. 11 TaxID=1416808 RepID=A0A261UDQ8_9BORD|nr:tagatose 1,6-diphosphate aldolase [Bordetella genomosp. 11]OZI60059.1 tagatose-bisphosphate aldolase [Bordetella genomosp. 11]
MPAELHLGKTWGLRRMATPDGHFAMVALDQRPPIINLVAARRGIAPQEVAFTDVIDIKRLLVGALGSHASAMLFDPNYAFPAALPCLPAHTGLVVTLEDHRFQDTPGGRLSHSIRDWSVEKIKRIGGDGVKVLAWYRPDASPEVRSHQQRYVEEIGRECRKWDIPLVLELLVYPFARSAGHTTDYVEAAEKLPELVIESVREFADPRYGVDLFKLESPLPGASLPARDGGAGHLAAQAWFDRMGDICAQAAIPWVMLSAGVTGAQFVRVMEYAYAAGANGFLAGRAIWGEALQSFPDLARCDTGLREQGQATLRELGALTVRSGRPWTPDYASLSGISAEGEFCAAYA